jgi:hypothetical protein
LLSTLPEQQGGKSSIVIPMAGSWICKDTFFMMTDALACWFFEEKEAGRQPWNVLGGFDTQDGMLFSELVASLRSTGALKNDDVTLVRIIIE